MRNSLKLFETTIYYFICDAFTSYKEAWLPDDDAAAADAAADAV